MKSVLLFLILAVGVHYSAKADTIDFYHVYFNTSVIRKYNLHDANKTETLLSFKKDTLQSDDSIQIRYWNDTGTGSSGTLKVYAESGNLLKELEFENEFYTIPATLIRGLEKATYRVTYFKYLPNLDREMEYSLFYIQIE